MMLICVDGLIGQILERQRSERRLPQHKLSRAHVHVCMCNANQCSLRVVGLTRTLIVVIN